MYSLSLTLCEQPKVLTHRRSVPGTEEEEGVEGGMEEEEEEEAPQVAVIVVVIFLVFPTTLSPSLPASADAGERGGDVDACRRLLLLLLLLLLLVLVEILRGRTTSPTAGWA